MKLTKLEKNVYDFICEYWEKNHFSPSINDIAKGCFISYSTAYDYIHRLFDKEYVYFVPKIPRSITIKEKQ